MFDLVSDLSHAYEHLMKLLGNFLYNTRMACELDMSIVRIIHDLVHLINQLTLQTHLTRVTT